MDRGPGDQPCPSEVGGREVTLFSEWRQGGRAGPAGLRSWQKVVVQMGIGPRGLGTGAVVAGPLAQSLELTVLLGTHEMFSF